MLYLVSYSVCLFLGGMKVGVDLKGWLSCDPKHSFKSWKQQMPSKSTEQTTTSVSKMKKEEVRNFRLIEKYGGRWREKTRRHVLQLKLLQSNWLRLVMFNPSSQAARTMACNVVEALCQVSFIFMLLLLFTCEII